MSKQDAAKQFFDQLEKDEALRAKIKLGLETLAKIAAGYDVTEDELAAELRRRWECNEKASLRLPYSEPPGY
jgi:hypothetical protein